MEVGMLCFVCGFWTFLLRTTCFCWVSARFNVFFFFSTRLGKAIMSDSEKEVSNGAEDSDDTDIESGMW